MKILLVSLFLPHPRVGHAGGRYVFELLRHLAENHELDLATRYEEGEAPLLDDLRPFCRQMYAVSYTTKQQRGLLDKLGLILNYLSFSRFADRLIAQGDYDLVQVEWVEAAVLIRRHGTPLLLDAHDVMTKPFRRRAEQASGMGRFLAGPIAAMVQRVELGIMKRFDRIVTLSEYDREFLRGLWPDVPVSTVPIPAGMDLMATEYERRRGTILFLASFKYRPVNVEAALWFYKRVFPLVRSRVPEARFIIAGYGPPSELTMLEADPQVEVTGFVDDLDRCYKEAAVFVAPILTGGGIIVKLLDALAAATPTVATTYGNEGVGAVPGRDLLVADSPGDFAEAVVKLLTDQETADRIGSSGKRFVAATYEREAILSRLDALHSELCRNS